MKLHHFVLLILTCVLSTFVTLPANPLAEMSRAEQLAVALNSYQQLAATSLTGEPDFKPAALVKCGLPAVFQLRALERQYGKQAGISELLARPSDEDFPLTYDSPGGHFKIHYTMAAGDRDRIDESYGDQNTNGIPDYPEIVARIADSCWAHHIDEYGFIEPLNDAAYGGGDARYDIYIRDVGGSVYGITWPDQFQQDGAILRATSWMELDTHYEDYFGYDNRPLDALRVTIAHEFLHASHLTYDIEELCTDGACTPTGQNPYWFEMSAVWIEEETYDNINDYYYYIPSYIDELEHELSYISDDNLSIYGAGIFPMFLSQRYGRDIVRDIWERCAESPGEDFLFGALQEAIIAATDGEEDFEDAWLEYAKALFYTGTRARPGKYFEEAAAYSMVPDFKGSPPRPYIRYYTQYPITRQQSGDNAFQPAPLGINYLNFSTGTLDSLFSFEFQGQTSSPIPIEWRMMLTGYNRFNLSAPLRTDTTHYGNFDIIEARELEALTDLMMVVTIVNPELLGSTSPALQHGGRSYRFEVTSTSVPVEDNTVLFANSKFRLADAAENPFYVIVQLTAAADVDMMIFNAAGEKVFKSEVFPVAAGDRQPIQWAGRNDRGEEVASGVYIVQVRYGDETTHQKILVIR